MKIPVLRLSFVVWDVAIKLRNPLGFSSYIKTMLKDQLFKQVDCSLATGFSGLKSSRHFRETGTWTPIVDGDGGEPLHITSNTHFNG